MGTGEGGGELGCPEGLEESLGLGELGAIAIPLDPIEDRNSQEG